MLMIDVPLRVPATSLQSLAPQQVPPVPGNFTGRKGALARLDEGLCSSLHGGSASAVHPTVAVSGPAGIGKTALLAQWLQIHSERFPDGQLYIDLRANSPDGPLRPQEVLDRLLRSLGVSPVPPDIEEQRALWRSLTDRMRMAIILDNALDADHVSPLLSSSTRSLTVVISRQKLSWFEEEGIILHELGPLDPDSAMELFQRGLGRTGRRRVAREGPAARQVISTCTGNPLAICLVSARAASRPDQPIATLFQALTQKDTSLCTEQAERDVPVQAALDESYRRLPEDAARAYRLIGLLPVTDFNESVIAAVCAVSLREAAETLDALVEMNLAEDSGQNRYRFHDSVLWHARLQAKRQETETTRRKAVRRFLDWCLVMLTMAESLLCPGRRILERDYEAFRAEQPLFTDAEGALDWLKHEYSRLMAALRVAADGGWYSTAWQLADAMWPIFLRLRPYSLWIEAHEIGLTAAKQAGDLDGVVRMLTSGGAGLQNVGRLDEATEWFAHALAIARKRGNRWDEAQAMHGIGQSHWLANRLGSAKDWLGQALKLREDLSHRRGAALTRICLGDIARLSGRLDEARDLLVRARADLTAEGDSHDAARATAFLGMTHADANDIEEAQRQLLLARRTFAKVQSAPWEARALEMLGQVEEQHGGTATARHYFEQSLSLYQLNSPRDAKRLKERICGLDKLGGNGSGSPAGQ
ncbi:tetratricopeptide repeat protein [Streptomyces sp. NPDC059396]|uniref:tetratricopeptide repeat protein n=1 Tax=Streptomyces sp. NPDC059396 TaxID=3346819 RepID=UPI003684DA89